MAKSELNAKHSDWLTVGEALRLTKPVLENFIEPLVKVWHAGVRKQLIKEGKCNSSCNVKKKPICDKLPGVEERANRRCTRESPQ